MTKWLSMHTAVRGMKKEPKCDDESTGTAFKVSIRPQQGAATSGNRGLGSWQAPDCLHLDRHYAGILYNHDSVSIGGIERWRHRMNTNGFY